MMLFDEVQEFSSHIKANTRIMGLDMGMARIGIAFTSKDIDMPFPHSVYSRRSLEHDYKHLYNLCLKNDVSGIVVGIPLDIDQSISSLGKTFKKFIEGFTARYLIPCIFQDEYNSTQYAREILEESGFSRKKKQSLDDKIAASYILGEFIKRLYNERF